MVDLTNIHHNGIAVADIDKAVADYGRDLGLRFAPIRDFDPLPFWTPEEGAHEVRVRATYSTGQGPHLELVQGEGPFYDPAHATHARHIGVWTQDVKGDADRLVAAGWRVKAANAAPDAGYGIIAYLVSPGDALLVELVSTDLRPMIDDWLAGA